MVPALTVSRLPITLVDGTPSTAVSCANRAFMYGDGLFETLPLVDGAPQHWERHFARLQAGAVRLGIDCPPAVAFLADLHDALAAADPLPRAVLKITLIRGDGGRGYAPAPTAPAVRVVQLFAWPVTTMTENLEIILCANPLGINPRLAGMKHLNRLEQVLGADEVARAGADEGVMFDVHDCAIAGTRSNLFVVHGKEVSTPRLNTAGIDGIMRQVVMEHLARGGHRVRESVITRADLASCTELFLTNSLRGVQSVSRLRSDGGVRPLATAFTSVLRRELLQAGQLP